MQVKIVATGNLLSVPKTPLIEILKQAGVIEYVPEVVAPRVAKTTWSLHGPETGTIEPHIKSECATCSQSFAYFNVTEKSRFAHCGVVEYVPADLFAAYLRMTKRDEASQAKRVEKKKELLKNKSFYVEL